MNQDIKQALTNGLLAGYAGETEFKSIDRGGFEMKQSHYDKDGIIYHDEWLPNRTGGGQELVEIEGQQFTRTYAGGLIGEEKLKTLGIDEDDVIGTLINQIKLAHDKTRLDSDYESVEGDWKYSYRVEKEIEDIGLIVGKEKIKYKDDLVFVHYFLISPIS